MKRSKVSQVQIASVRRQAVESTSDEDVRRTAGISDLIAEANPSPSTPL